ncbi:MAG: DUF3426 domain-containing protein [Propionivibrio sp.]
MKSRCPNCQTVFRVTPEQLKARAGKVRCGQCQSVFNALDSLHDEAAEARQAPARETAFQVLSAATAPAAQVNVELAAAPIFADPAEEPPQEPSLDPAYDETHTGEPEDGFFISSSVAEPHLAPAPGDEPALSDEPIEAQEDVATAPTTGEDTDGRMSESAVQELAKATGLIMPRETTEIPGYSKWSEGLIAAPVTLPSEKPTRWPFVLVSLLLVLALAGQAIFHFRSELATTMPSLRPLLSEASAALGRDLPLPSHVELISIELSDLQNDPAHGNLLVLNATLRNRAAYTQALPSLELSLTDTQDSVVARRIFTPADYLSDKSRERQGFAAGTDLTLRLWIEAKDITAAGYRLYVFYP